MRMFYALLFVVCCGAPVHAENRRTIRHIPEREMSPREGDRSSWDYVPKNLAEAHEQLERLLPPAELEKIDRMKSEELMIEYHRSLGMNLRNQWGLWKGSRLADDLRKLGFHHPDDISMTILETFWDKRHGKDFRLEERAEFLRKYWEAYALPPKTEVDPRDASEIEWTLGRRPPIRDAREPAHAADGLGVDQPEHVLGPGRQAALLSRYERPDVSRH